MSFFDFTTDCSLYRMPKEELHLYPLREVRAKKRKAFGTGPPANVYFQVIGNGCAGGATSLFLFTDHHRYLVAQVN